MGDAVIFLQITQTLQKSATCNTVYFFAQMYIHTPNSPSAMPICYTINTLISYIPRGGVHVEEEKEEVVRIAIPV